MIVPHGEGSKLSFRLPIWVIFCLVIFLFLSGSASTIFVMHYRNIRAEQMLLQRGRREDKVRAAELGNKLSIQERELFSLRKQSDLLLQRLKELDRLDREIRELAGLAAPSDERLAELEFKEGGQGGGTETLSLTEEAGVGLDQSRAVAISGVAMIWENFDRFEKGSAITKKLDKDKQVLVERRAIAAATPSIWPVVGWISSFFGRRKSPIDGKWEMHNGVDIIAPTGTSIRATADGVVQFSGWKSGYGNTVIINHGYGFSTLYAHNSANLVKKGQWVRRGDAIAYLGSTGRSTGPHCHYEVRIKDRPTDPLNYLP